MSEQYTESQVLVFNSSLLVRGRGGQLWTQGCRGLMGRWTDRLLMDAQMPIFQLCRNQLLWVEQSQCLPPGWVGRLPHSLPWGTSAGFLLGACLPLLGPLTQP